MQRTHSIYEQVRRDARQRLLKGDSLEAQVFQSLVRVGAKGLTDDDLNGMLGGDGCNIRPRRIALLAAGFVAPAYPLQKRRTRKGKFATVWVATGLGK